MGMLGTLLLLPLRGPLDATLWVAGRIGEAAERQWNDPAALRAALAAAEQRLLAGELSEAEYDALETELLERLRAAG